MSSKAAVLRTHSLGYAVELGKKAKSRVSEEYIRYVIDFVVVKGRSMLRVVGYNLVSDNNRT